METWYNILTITESKNVNKLEFYAHALPMKGFYTKRDVLRNPSNSLYQGTEYHEINLANLG